MADLDLGVPVRSQADGSDEKLHSKIVGHATTHAVGDTAQNQAIVDANGRLYVDANIQNLDNATDDVLVYGWDGAANQKLATDAQGRIILSPVESNSPEVDVHEYNIVSAAAKNAVTTPHTYTPAAGKVLHLKAIHCAASASAHYEIKTGPTGSETTLMFVFLSAAVPNHTLKFSDEIGLDDTMSLVIQKTNKDGQAQDMHDLIDGTLV